MKFSVWSLQGLLVKGCQHREPHENGVIGIAAHCRLRIMPPNINNVIWQFWLGDKTAQSASCRQRNLLTKFVKCSGHTLHNLTYEDAIEMALDKPLWRLLAASGATHWWCMPNDDDDDDEWTLAVVSFYAVRAKGHFGYHNPWFCFILFNIGWHGGLVCVISYFAMLSYCSLVRPANLDQLVNYVLQNPADDDNEKTKYKLVSACYFQFGLTGLLLCMFFEESCYGGKWWQWFAVQLVIMHVCRYPNISCELLTSDICQITDALVSGGTLFTSLMNFLESDRPLNPLQASFYGKLVALLISRRGELVWHCYTHLID